jgi:hypothetical protein
MNLLKLILFCLLVFIPLIGFTGCGNVRGLADEQAELVAWYIEDVARGTTRNPDELVLPMSTPEMERIAGWLAGSQIKEQRVQPSQINERQKRWSALHALFLQGEVMILTDGLVAPSPTLSRADQIYILPIVDAENQDRRSIDALIISISKTDHNGAQRWLAMSAAARLALDTKAGATHWKLPAIKPNDPRLRVVP